MHRKPETIFANLNIDVQGSRSKVEGERCKMKVRGEKFNLVAKVWILEHECDQLLLLQAFYLGFTLLYLQNKFIKSHFIFEFMMVRVKTNKQTDELGQKRDEWTDTCTNGKLFTKVDL